MARTGRRRGPNTSREAILQAARQRFAAAGFEATSIRAIAADAGVDPGVVMHFFGSKDGLFRAAVGWPFDPALFMAQIAAASTESIGSRVARAFLGFWDDPATRAGLSAVFRSAMTHAASAALVRQFVAHELYLRLSDVVAGPPAQLPADLAASHLIGVAVLRYILRVEPIASASTDELVVWLTPALNHYLGSDGADGATGGARDDVPDFRGTIPP